jgi:NADH:ubiquinone oxidoreductase subunit K
MSILIGLFIISLIAFLFSGRHLILMLLAIELMLFVVAFRFLYFGWIFDDLAGAHFSLYLLVLAGAESAVALSLIVMFHRIRGSIKL